LRVKTSSGLILSIKSYNDSIKENTILRLQIFPKRLSFISYLKGGFIPSRVKGIKQEGFNLRGYLKTLIYSQHKNLEIASLYSAIFLATPISNSLRDKISKFGINHLVALSGLHLSILWGVIFILFSPLYRLIQAKFFPYRYSLIDLGAFSLIVLLAYLNLTNSPPSLFRSYIMLATGWFALLIGVELISFQFLALIVALVLLIEPSFILSISFWLSVAGVFYIYLLIKHFARVPKTILTLLIIPFGVYILMIPIVHTLFFTLSPLQWLSPILSILFTIFYPLTLFLHIVGFGALFDGALIGLLNTQAPITLKALPFSFSLFYLFASLLAIRYNLAFRVTLILAFSSIWWLYIF